MSAFIVSYHHVNYLPCKCRRSQSNDYFCNNRQSAFNFLNPMITFCVMKHFESLIKHQPYAFSLQTTPESYRTHLQLGQWDRHRRPTMNSLALVLRSKSSSAPNGAKSSLAWKKKSRHFALCWHRKSITRRNWSVNSELLCGRRSQTTCRRASRTLRRATCK